MRSHSSRAMMTLAILSVLTGYPGLLRGEQPAIEFKMETGRVVITSRDRPLATYVYADDKISRPYFAHVYGLGKAQLTRNHPPQQVDHAGCTPQSSDAASTGPCMYSSAVYRGPHATEEDLRWHCRTSAIQTPSGSTDLSRI